MMNISKATTRLWSRLGSCGAYGQAMLEMPSIDESMVACTADLCFYSGLDRFSKQFPDRFYNVGIAEQDLVGIGAGLAKEGFNPFVSTYASFATTRALDQVRVSMGYMQLPIKLIGLTSGCSVGILGATHISIEDIAIMRAIPNITVISPADCTETVKAVLALANYDKPVYLRLSGPMNCDIVYPEDYEFEIGKAITVREGGDYAIVACGVMVATALKVADMLAENDGITCKVIDMHTIKPLDKGALDSLRGFKKIITMEEHSVIGGLGAAVAEYISCRDGFPMLKIIGIEDYFAHAAGFDELIDEYGLTAEKAYMRILDK